MRHILFVFSIFLSSLLTLSEAAPDPVKSASSVKTGFAERDISPEIGAERPGGYRKAFHQEHHDACKVRAVVFEEAGKSVALVGIDALILREPQVAAARKEITKRTGIAPEAVLIGASHSHSSGPTGMVLPGEYDQADELAKKLAYEESSAADTGYLDLVVTSIIDAVTEAYEKRAELELGFGRGEEASVSFNRRWRMKDGGSHTHPGYGNPDRVEPAGPTDPEVGVIGAWDEAGNLLGCVVNFACHATTSPRGISANYISALEKVIRGTYGEETVMVFLNGASGDVTQVDNSSPSGRLKGGDEMMFVGGRIGAEAVKVLLGIRKNTTTQAKLEYRTTHLNIARRVPSPERVARCREIAKERPSDAAALNDWIWAKEIVMLDALIKQEPIRSVEVQAIQVGPAVFVTSPAEYFCEFGLQQKEASPFPFTWPVSLANGCVGYVPTKEAFGPNGGGYETRLTSYSNLIPEAGDQIRDAGIALIKDLSPGSLPEAPTPPEFKGGWPYGNVGPELE